MKIKSFLIFIIVLIMLIATVACSNGTVPVDTTGFTNKSTGQIYLYGEHHGVEEILNKEFQLWSKYYHEENMRHLFVELPYYTAEFLNLWMKSEDDHILEELYKDSEGTPANNTYTKEFYKTIKLECPETIFHGTDIGHQYNITGQRFLKYLENNNLEGSEKYILAQESIEQGEFFYSGPNHVYRENKMVENFIREFDKLKDEDIMGIYGAAHTDFEAMDYMTQSVPCMANQLKKHYGDSIHTEDLSWLVKDIEPLRVDRITINEKDYEALYFGKQDLKLLKGYSYREFWRLEDAYEDFRDMGKNGHVLPYDNYPMKIEIEQVFVIDCIKTDGSVERNYYRSDGHIWNNMPATEEFIAE